MQPHAESFELSIRACLAHPRVAVRAQRNRGRGFEHRPRGTLTGDTRSASLPRP